MVKDKRNEIIDIGRVKYIGKGKKKRFDDLSVIEAEERERSIEESRFRRRFRI